MMKTAAICLAVLLGLFFFQPQIKSATMRAQMTYTLARVDLAEEKKDELSEIFSRIGKGYRTHQFDDLEKVTLRRLMADLGDYKGSEMPEKEAERLIQRFEVILARHRL